VHQEAEKLEHAVSDDFIARIDAMLGYPKRDPHGDPIPSESGDIEGVVRTDLTDIRIGESVVVDRINDSDPELLRYLASAGVGPGTVLRAESAPYAGMRVFAIVSDSSDAVPQTIHVADSALWAIKATPQES
jgi:DtxR family Mn-dependent transcriptional regulator